jgi:antitoxin HigA-1
MALRSPIHPGEIVRERIEALGLSVAKAAAALGVHRSALYRTLDGSVSLQPEMALRLEAVFAFSAEDLLMKQVLYDVYLARTTRPDIIEGLQRAPAQFPQREGQPCP